MQINDALFPIGSYTHSYGLETYIQQDKVTNGAQAKKYIINNLRYNFLYNDLLAFSLAYDMARANQVEEIKKLESDLTAIKVCMETRKASQKLGTRFLKIINSLQILDMKDVFRDYIRYEKIKIPVHQCVAYGVFSYALGFEKEIAMKFFLYSSTSNMVTNCVKTIPLSQTVGQQILYELGDELEEIIHKCLLLNRDDLGLSCPSLDISCMQHEVLYSRIYMS